MAANHVRSSCSGNPLILEENAWPVVVEARAVARSAGRSGGCAAGSDIVRSNAKVELESKLSLFYSLAAITYPVRHVAARVIVTGIRAGLIE